MNNLGETSTGRFCWVDLAATDADCAKSFYAKLFGWTAVEQPANGGSFTRLQASGQDVGSLYQLSRVNLEKRVPSHWTHYVRVADVEDAARRAVLCGGEVIVRPFAVPGMARVAVIVDPVGALVGLWQPHAAETEQNAYA